MSLAAIKPLHMLAFTQTDVVVCFVRDALNSSRFNLELSFCVGDEERLL